MKSEERTQDGAMEAVAEAAGWYAAARLAAYLGGKTLHVPERLSAGHPIVLVLGLEKARQISDMMGGEDIELPTTLEVQKEMEIGRRDATICEMAARGIETRTIAKWARVGRPTVRHVLDEKRAIVEAYKANLASRPEAQK